MSSPIFTALAQTRQAEIERRLRHVQLDQPRRVSRVRALIVARRTSQSVGNHRRPADALARDAR